MNRKKIGCLLIGGILCILAIILVPKRYYTWTLNQAIQENDYERVQELVAGGGDISRRNSCRLVEYIGFTPLQEACVNGEVKTITLLLQNGAEVDGAEGTALTLVLANDYPAKYEVVKLLFEYGLDIEKQQISPMDVLISRKYSDEFRGLKNLAANTRNTKETLDIMLLLIEHGVKIKADDLHDERFGKEEILQNAIRQGNIYIVEYLVDEVMYDPNMLFPDGSRPLFEAIQYENKEIVECLISYGADKSIKNSEGKDALDLAGEKSLSEIVEILE